MASNNEPPRTDLSRVTIVEILRERRLKLQTNEGGGGGHGHALLAAGPGRGGFAEGRRGGTARAIVSGRAKRKGNDKPRATVEKAKISSGQAGLPPAVTAGATMGGSARGHRNTRCGKAPVVECRSEATVVCTGRR